MAEGTNPVWLDDHTLFVEDTSCLGPRTEGKCRGWASRLSASHLTTGATTFDVAQWQPFGIDINRDEEGRAAVPEQVMEIPGPDPPSRPPRRQAPDARRANEERPKALPDVIQPP